MLSLPPLHSLGAIIASNLTVLINGLCYSIDWLLILVLNVATGLTSKLEMGWRPKFLALHIYGMIQGGRGTVLCLR
jgi:hypothetical protein